MPRDPNHLTPEADGRFCKRVRGQLYHFGRNGDRDLAVKEWLAAKDDLLAGRRMRRAPLRETDRTIRLLVNTFLTDCTSKVTAGKMTGGTFDDYNRALKEFGGAVGLGRDPDDLKPTDFASVRATWAKRMGPWSLDRYVQAVRTMFNYAVAHRLIDREPFYGSAFAKSTEAEKRATGRSRVKDRGERVFTADELTVILAAATGQVRTMILLALNGGMYAKDVAALEWSDIHEEAGVWVVDFSRGKTGGVPWKFPLWPETKAALDAVIRHKPRHAADAQKVFITCHGRSWHREHTRRDGDKIEASGTVDAIAQEFDKILANIFILIDPQKWKWRLLKRKGVGFGSFRHTHVSAVGDHADVPAQHRVSGHKAQGVRAKHYDKIPVHRLLSVVNLARERLLPHA